MRRLRVALGQVNPTVGDFDRNVRMIVEAIDQARARGCALVAFPELAITGYPPEDLLFKPAFIEANLKALDEVTRASRGLSVVVGFVDKRDDIFNAAAVLHDGTRAGVYHKQYLPNYGVFDENRYFQAGTEAPVFVAGQTTFALHGCEDIWYPAGPASAQAPARAELGVREAATRVRLPTLPASEAPPLPPREVATLSQVEEVFGALVLGTRDYVRKNGFKRVVIGLSGGIDSSLVAAVAVEALGRENVAGVGMPSAYSSTGTRRDAQRLAKHLGIEFLAIPITPLLNAYKRSLAKAFKGMKEDVTEENIQARIRGNLLMALSNKFGWLVLTTGNKSEYSVGYTTLYGDMAGGFAVIKDVPKMLVYDVARHVNARAGRPVIPETVFTRAPSAELRPNQTDQDTLPPYAELDSILEGYVENDRGINDMIAAGHVPDTVRKVVSMIDRNEYKRRQGPIGVKITPRAFGRDWRLPIVNRFREI